MIQQVLLLVKTIWLGVSLVREILNSIEHVDVKEELSKADKVEMVKELRDGLRMAKKNNDTSAIESAFNDMANQLSKRSRL